MKYLKKVFVLSFIAGLFFSTVSCNNEAEEDDYPTEKDLILYLYNLTHYKECLIQSEDGLSYIYRLPSGSLEECLVFDKDNPENPYTYNDEPVDVIEQYLIYNIPNYNKYRLEKSEKSTGYISTDGTYKLYSKKGTGRIKISYKKMTITTSHFEKYRFVSNSKNNYGICCIPESEDLYFLPLDVEEDGPETIRIEPFKIKRTEITHTEILNRTLMKSGQPRESTDITVYNDTTYHKVYTYFN